MKLGVVFLFCIIMLFFSSHICAERINKTVFGLELLYNYFYDREYYDYLCDSLIEFEADEVPDENVKRNIPGFITTFINNSWLTFKGESPLISVRIYGTTGLLELRALGAIPGIEDYKYINFEFFEGKIELANLPYFAKHKRVDSISYFGLPFTNKSISCKDFNGERESTEKYGIISGRIIGCDATPQTRSNLIIRRKVKVPNSGPSTKYYFDPSFNDAQFETDDTGYFVSPDLPPGLYIMDIYPQITEIATNDVTDKNSAPAVAIQPLVCVASRVEIRVAPDSASIINITLHTNDTAVFPRIDRTYHTWNEYIIPINSTRGL